MVDYYRRRAHGGVGLILTEGTPPDASGAFGSTVPRFFGVERAQWRHVVEAVHAQGARIMPQLWHVGAFDPSLIGMADSAEVERISPSGLAAPGRTLGRGMNERDIETTIAAYAPTSLAVTAWRARVAPSSSCANAGAASAPVSRSGVSGNPQP